MFREMLSIDDVFSFQLFQDLHVWTKYCEILKSSSPSNDEVLVNNLVFRFRPGNCGTEQ